MVYLLGNLRFQTLYVWHIDAVLHDQVLQKEHLLLNVLLRTINECFQLLFRLIHLLILREGKVSKVSSLMLLIPWRFGLLWLESGHALQTLLHTTNNVFFALQIPLEYLNIAITSCHCDHLML